MWVFDGYVGFTRGWGLGLRGLIGSRVQGLQGL